MEYNVELHKKLDLALNNFTVFISKDLKSDAVKQCMMLRHDIFCVDRKFEPISEDGLERDRFDKDAVHFLIVKNDGDVPFGTARVVVGKEFPCREFIDTDDPEHPEEWSDQPLGEVSRVIIADQFRKSTEGLNALLVLFSAVSYWANKNNLKRMYSCMEPVLTRRVGMIDGLNVKKVGKPVSFKGLRQVSIIDSLELIQNRMKYLDCDIDLSHSDSFKSEGFNLTMKP